MSCEARGEARGELKGERKLLLHVLTSRLGVPDGETTARLDSIESLEILEQLGVRLLQVETWLELLSEL